MCYLFVFIQTIHRTIGDLDMIAHHFDGYGKEFAKSQKLSPDALIQVSIQLAYRR